MKDSELFAKLHNTKLGDAIIEYVEGMQNRICDSRNWGQNETKEGANRLASVLQKDIIDKIKKNENPRPGSPDEFK